jgi:hypothetical protein
MNWLRLISFMWCLILGVGCATSSDQRSGVRIRLLPLANNYCLAEVVRFIPGRSMMEEHRLHGGMISSDALGWITCGMVVENASSKPISLPPVWSKKWRLVLIKNGTVVFDGQLFQSRLPGDDVFGMIQPGEDSLYILGSDDYYFIRRGSDSSSKEKMSMHIEVKLENGASLYSNMIDVEGHVPVPESVLHSPSTPDPYPFGDLQPADDKVNE